MIALAYITAALEIVVLIMFIGVVIEETRKIDWKVFKDDEEENKDDEEQ